MRSLVDRLDRQQASSGGLALVLGRLPAELSFRMRLWREQQQLTAPQRRQARELNQLLRRRRALHRQVQSLVLARRTLERLITPDPSPALMNGGYTTTHQVDWVSGACMLVKREYLIDVGLMDERYFMYVEDMDWCRAFANKGYQVWYLPDWTVKHDATRASSRRSSILNRFLWFHLISLSRYYIKWYLHKPHSQQRG